MIPVESAGIAVVVVVVRSSGSVVVEDGADASRQ
jgi:hypothetical protein